MQLKKVISISNSNRHTLTIKKSLLSKTNRIVKSIVQSNKKSNGRSSINGRITVWHKGDRVKNSYIKNMSAGSLIHNLTLNNSSKTKYIRSAGTFGQIVQSRQTTAKIKLPSKKIIEVSINNLATIWVVSNSQHNLTILRKAGTNINLGKRPTKSGYYLKKRKKNYAIK